MWKQEWKVVLRLASLLCCIAALLGLISVSLAEDCFTLNVDVLNMDLLNNNDYVAQNLSAQAQGIRVQKTISESSELAQVVRLTLVQMDTQTLLFDKDYGYQSFVFDSGAIYLPYVDNRTIPYLVTLYVGNTVYAMPFMQLQPRLKDNSACTYGIRLRDLEYGLSSDWLMGTMLDLNNLRAMGSQSLNLCASNAYLIGQATVLMENEAVSVQLQFLQNAAVELRSASVYLITDCSQIGGDPQNGGFPSYSPGEWIPVSGADSAFLYLPMRLSYDSAGLSPFGYDLNGGELQAQLGLWQQNRTQAGQVVPQVSAAPESLLPEQIQDVPAIVETPLPTATPIPADPLVAADTPVPTQEGQDVPAQPAPEEASSVQAAP